MNPIENLIAFQMFSDDLNANKFQSEKHIHPNAIINRPRLRSADQIAMKEIIFRLDQGFFRFMTCNFRNISPQYHNIVLVMRKNISP